MSFRGRDDSSGGNPSKLEMGDSRRFGGMENEKVDSDDRSSRFDSSRGRRPPFGRGRRSSPGRDKPFGDRPRDFGNYGRNESDYMPPSNRDMMRERSPLHGSEDRYSDRFKKSDRRDDPGRKEQGRFYDDPPRDRYMGMDNRTRHEGSGNFGSRFDASNDFKHRSMNFSAPPKNYCEGFPKPNECEIIAMNKQQRDYAESVEARLKVLGILVDILFLKDEALLTQTIDDIARKGSLYAMVISPQNETHGSVTVNILHGTPQEHRNMPLEDALKLISRNFHDHICSQKEYMERERAERGPYMGIVSADREMQLLLRMLADGRWISLAEINSVILYLSERRDKIQGAVGDERVRPRLPAPAPDLKIERSYKPKDDTDVAQKEQDLQNRIINLMNQGPSPTANAPPASMNQGAMPNIDLTQIRANQPRMSPGVRPNINTNISGMQSVRPGLDENLPSQQKVESNLPVPDTTSTSYAPVVSNAPKSDSTTTTPTYINFDNPSVQKALDNLMQSGPNILKSISLSNTNMSATSQNTLPVKSSSIDTGVGHQNENMGMNAPSGNVGPQRNLGSRNMPDMGASMAVRNPPNMDVGPPRNMSNINIGNLPPQRGPASNSDLNLQPGGYGRGISNIRGMNTGSGNIGRGYGGGGNMGDLGLGSRMSSGLPDMGRMGQQRPGGNIGSLQNQDMNHGPPSLGMSQGSNFQSQNQFNKYQGPGQQGNFGPSFNSGNMGGMPRPNFGGPQGMGMGPRRY